MTDEQVKGILEAVGCLHAFKDMLLEACANAPGEDAKTATNADVEAFLVRNLAIMNQVYEQASTATLHLGEALGRANPTKPKTN